MKPSDSIGRLCYFWEVVAGDGWRVILSCAKLSLRNLCVSPVLCVNKTSFTAECQRWRRFRREGFAKINNPSPADEWLVDSVCAKNKFEIGFLCETSAFLPFSAVNKTSFTAECQRCQRFRRESFANNQQPVTRHPQQKKTVFDLY